MKQPLEFRFKDVIDELEAFRKTAREFLYLDADQVLTGYIDQLRYLQETPHQGGFIWQIPSNSPLQTRVSNGEHNPSGKGIPVYAAIDAVWAIRRVAHRSGKKRPADFVAMAGEASVRVCVRAPANADHRLRTDQDPELAMWRMELGDVASPGCHFHIQVRGQTPDAPFPQSLAIPRLPSLAVTPAAAFEYVIAELFQAEWNRHVEFEHDRFVRWRKLQCDALTRLLEWQIQEIKGAPASPWTSLKLAKPDVSLFTA
jgi:hypothetical protein